MAFYPLPTIVIKLYISLTSFKIIFYIDIWQSVLFWIVSFYNISTHLGNRNFLQQVKKVRNSETSTNLKEEEQSRLLLKMFAMLSKLPEQGKLRKYLPTLLI